MLNPLVTKLDHVGGWVGVHHGLLDFGPSRKVPPDFDIAADGSEISHTSLLLAGFACRYKLMGDGRRAILGFVLPGDFTSLPFPDRQRLGFGVKTLTPCEFVNVSCAHLRKLASHTPRLETALWALTQMDQAILLSWLAHISQCPADKRLAHLLCELRARLAMVGLADDHNFRLPLTQEELADALGISTVHVNRMLQNLRELGMIRWKGAILYIPDLGQLEAYAGFAPAYLDPEGAVTPVGSLQPIV